MRLLSIALLLATTAFFQSCLHSPSYTIGRVTNVTTSFEKGGSPYLICEVTTPDTIYKGIKVYEYVAMGRILAAKESGVLDSCDVGIRINGSKTVTDITTVARY